MRQWANGLIRLGASGSGQRFVSPRLSVAEEGGLAPLRIGALDSIAAAPVNQPATVGALDVHFRIQYQVAAGIAFGVVVGGAAGFAPDLAVLVGGKRPGLVLVPAVDYVRCPGAVDAGPSLGLRPAGLARRVVLYLGLCWACSVNPLWCLDHLLPWVCAVMRFCLDSVGRCYFPPCFSVYPVCWGVGAGALGPVDD